MWSASACEEEVVNHIVCSPSFSDSQPSAGSWSGSRQSGWHVYWIWLPVLSSQATRMYGPTWGRVAGHCGGGAVVVVVGDASVGCGTGAKVPGSAAGTMGFVFVGPSSAGAGAHAPAFAARSATVLLIATPNSPTVRARALLSSAHSVWPFGPTSRRPRR